MIDHLKGAGKEGDGAAILILGGFDVFLDDFDAVFHAREVARKLVGGYEAWPRVLEMVEIWWGDCIPTGPPPTTRTSTCSTGTSGFAIFHRGGNF